MLEELPVLKGEKNTSPSGQDAGTGAQSCAKESLPRCPPSGPSSPPSGGHAHHLRSWEELAGQGTAASRPSWSLWGAAAPGGEGDVSTAALRATL